nr:uncharacterized protein LOC109167710 isoform X1 [Ipomoea trifida]
MNFSLLWSGNQVCSFSLTCHILCLQGQHKTLVLCFFVMQDYNSLTKDIFPLFPFERKQKDGTISNSGSSAEFSKAKNLYITGHSNGAINFWDVSCPLMLPIVSLTQQSEDNFSLSGVLVTALCLVFDLHILISGEQNGMVKFEFDGKKYSSRF